MTLTADVAVVGAGPCGVTMANLLGTYGVRAVVLDREPAVVDYPRAVAIDDESLRTFQTAGVVHDVLDDLIQNAPIRYHNSRGQVLAHVRPSGQPFGWPRRNLFLQPLLEATLRRGLERFDEVQLLTAAEVTGLERTERGVHLTARRHGHELTVSARYLVGADGGRSFVRGAVGVDLAGRTSPARWLVVDVADDRLDAPYSAVYCHPDQPTMTIPLPYGHRRFEFRLPAEDAGGPDAGPTDEEVLELLAPFYRGLPLPTVTRHRVYWHHSRVATTFRSGPVFLAGDAAHLQPPFFGQGMNSGIRDATNLAWKLAAVVSGRADEAILDSYDAERRAHAEAMVWFATRMGALYSPRNRLTERVRDAVFRAAQRIPGARDYILQMKYKPLPRYTEGIVVHPAGGAAKTSPVGRMFGQPSVETAQGRRCRLDDAIGTGFALLGLGVDPARLLSPDDLAFWRDLGATTVRIDPARTARRAPVGDPPAARAEGAPVGSTVMEDADGAFRDLLLDRPGDRVVILRPDRYVFATCAAPALGAVTARARELLRPAAAQDAPGTVRPADAAPAS